MAFHNPITPRTKNPKRGRFIVPHTLRLMSSIAAVLFVSPPTVVIHRSLAEVIRSMSGSLNRHPLR